MKVFTKVIIAVITLLIVVGAFIILKGHTSRARDAHPPCDQLPTVEQATDALMEHDTFIKEIENLGDNVEVKIGKPCANDQSRGLIKVNYKTKSERDAIHLLLSRSEGLGVPVYLKKR